MSLFTIDQAKRANHSVGGHWFSPDTLRFFGSRLPRSVYPVPDGCIFVTSEYTGFSRTSRAYSVRFCSDTGQVDTVGEFNAYPTRQQAHTAAKREQAKRRQTAK